MGIHPVDLTIVVIYLLAVIGFGVWVGRGQRDISDYLLGDRNLPWAVVLLSIVATETSTATFLSVPGEAYLGDLKFLQLAFGYILGRYVVSVLLLPQYFRGQLYTAYQVLDRRFGGTTKRAASLLFIVMRNMADGLRLLLAGVVLKKILFPASPALDGFDSYLATAVVIMGAATILYTVFGGMKAVAWTDFIQFFIYMLGAACAVVIVFWRVPGGWGEVFRYAQEHGKLQVVDLSFDWKQSYTLWAGLIGGAFLTLGSHGADQLMVQRYLSARSQRHAASALRWSGWIVLAQFLTFLLLGVALARFYDGREFKQDEVFATFIIEELPIGVVGLTVAAVFAAAMSTLSSSLNSSAAAAVNDFYVPLFRPNADPQHSLRVTRGLTLVFGLVQIAVGVGGQFVQNNVITTVMKIAGFTMGIVLGLFLLGTLTKRVGQRAALVALLLGLTGMTLIYFQTPLAWPWYPVVGSLGTFAIGLAASYVLPEERASHSDEGSAATVG